VKLQTLDDPQKKRRTHIGRYAFRGVEEELEVHNLLDVRSVVGQKVVRKGGIVLYYKK
jgi:hypothetical protein